MDETKRDFERLSTDTLFEKWCQRKPTQQPPPSPGSAATEPSSEALKRAMQQIHDAGKLEPGVACKMLFQAVSVLEAGHVLGEAQRACGLLLAKLSGNANTSPTRFLAEPPAALSLVDPKLKMFFLEGQRAAARLLQHTDKTSAAHWALQALAVYIPQDTLHSIIESAGAGPKAVFEAAERAVGLLLDRVARTDPNKVAPLRKLLFSLAADAAALQQRALDRAALVLLTLTIALRQHHESAVEGDAGGVQEDHDKGEDSSASPIILQLGHAATDAYLAAGQRGSAADVLLFALPHVHARCCWRCALTHAAFLALNDRDPVRCERVSRASNTMTTATVTTTTATKDSLSPDQVASSSSLCSNYSFAMAACEAFSCRMSDWFEENALDCPVLFRSLVLKARDQLIL
eukprot:m.109133 g.109133  ORF g.109133 m.109133 type:complete len:404 (-) comp14300_c1_seq1:3901-5112(-)